MGPAGLGPCVTVVDQDARATFSPARTKVKKSGRMSGAGWGPEEHVAEEDLRPDDLTHPLDHIDRETDVDLTMPVPEERHALVHAETEFAGISRGVTYED